MGQQTAPQTLKIQTGEVREKPHTLGDCWTKRCPKEHGATPLPRELKNSKSQRILKDKTARALKAREGSTPNPKPALVFTAPSRLPVEGFWN
jgi:hypothetical protein